MGVGARLWEGKLFVKSVIVQLAILVFLITGVFPHLSFAAGVPVYQYDITVGSFSGYVDIYSYDWHDGGYPWRYYYKVFGYSPALSAGYYYAGTLSLRSVTGQLVVQAFNGSQWVEIQRISTWDGYYQYWRTLDYNIFLPFNTQQIRYVAYVSSFLNEYRNHSVSIGGVTYRVHLIGADQDTAQAAYDAASAANTNAYNAYLAANAAKSSADTVAARVWDSTEGKSAATLAKEARDKANQALTEISNVKSIVASIQSSVGPQILKVRGLNGATATRTNTFTVTVEAANATEFRARVDGGSWSAWTPVSTPIALAGFDAYGAHTIYVEVRNASGATATGQMTAFRL